MKLLVPESMASANAEPWKGRPAVHGSVAGRTVQPAGYETEIPCMADVNVSVSAGETEGAGMRLGEGTDDETGVASPPRPDPEPGRRTASPSAPTAIATTAATASLAKLFMS